MAGSGEEASEVIFNQFHDVVVNVIGQLSGDSMELSRHSPVEASEQIAPVTDDLLSSSIAIAGDQFHCNFVFAGRASTIRALCEIEVNDPGDWLGEMANRVAGKLKNNLSEYDVDCRLGLPENASGLVWNSDELAEAFVMRMPVGTVIAGIHVDVSPGLAWEYNPERVTAHEGSILLF